MLFNSCNSKFKSAANFFMEKLLHLFNTLWFERGSTSETPKLPDTNPPETTKLDKNESGSDPDRRLKISHGRSSSDQQFVLNLNTNNKLSDAESPKSVLYPTRRLETVVSGLEVGDFEVREEKVLKKKVVGRDRRMKGRRRSKSLTEMELEEVKGFMDLGFVFSEEDRKDSSLVSMIPGLQRLGCGNNEGDGVCRKCGRRCERKEMVPMRVDSMVDELDMKNQIKFWAHSVASAVR